MLSFRKLTLRRGPRVLLRELDATVHAGQRLGIVGRNGTGKSSLLAAIRGELGTDGGSIDLPGGITMASVAQESPSGPRSALDYVLDGDAEYRRIEQRLARAEASGDGDQLGALHERLLAIDGYAAPSRAGRLLHGLGFAPEQQDWALDRFSGGWRVRLNLAQALMCRSELLLLDEPTNHLDLDAVLWLQQWLLQYPGTLVLISHDRDFLDAVCDYILHLEHETGTVYRGGYSAFEAARAERLEQQAAQYKAQQQRLAHLQSYVDRFRAKATKARQAQSRLKQMERIEKVEPAHWDSPFSFAFAEPDRLPHPMLQLDKVDAGYGDTVILSGLKLGLGPGDRVGLLGRNGAGKSTLIKSIAGRIPTLRGHVHRDKHLQVGYFAQHALEQLDPAASPLLHLQRMDPKASDAALRNYLGGFDFRGDQALAACGNFSGGEKSRLALALIVYRRPNLLLLDEPTNHLDLDMRHALELALQAFTGAMVLVSHDRHLLDATCDRLWLTAGGRVEAFDGDLDDYARFLSRSESGSAATAPGSRPGAGTAAKSPALSPRQAKPLRSELKKLEARLQTLGERIADTDRQLGDPDIYGGDAGRLQALSESRGELQQQLDTAEARYLELIEALDSA